MKKPGILTRIYARCVLIYGRAYNFVGDAITLVKVASVEFWKMLCLIWKTWSFGTTWQCIKLTFGAMIMAWRHGKDAYKKRQMMRAVSLDGNLKLFSPQGFFEQAAMYVR